MSSGSVHISISVLKIYLHPAKRIITDQVKGRDRLPDKIFDGIAVGKIRKRGPRNFRKPLYWLGGRYWVRTNDFHRVKVTLYR